MAHQRPLGGEIARLAPKDDIAVRHLLADLADDQRSACGLTGAHRKGERAGERVFALANRGFKIADAKEGAGEALMNPEPDEQQGQNDEVGAAKDEALQLETFGSGQEKAPDDEEEDQHGRS